MDWILTVIKLISLMLALKSVIEIVAVSYIIANNDKVSYKLNSDNFIVAGISIAVFVFMQFNLF